ncbi:HD domain-containing protein [Inquilinus limosus]|uniref:HD domain-containing protein n=1 Tax=Inquilinus limosus TaxID=171674 RepID=UPI0009DC2860|nr:HD domain-containing protein [Inquilinus limosus]
MTALKPQRVRDPVHNLIAFDTSQFEHALWRVIQTPPFQRLRRIRQLGFSEFVFPGATHTRFAHSIGVFHVARALMLLIERHIKADTSRQFGEYQSRVALAAALVHDVGHGMFSHAFEEVGKSLNLPMAKHENVSEAIIRDSEITQAFNRDLGSGFANDVATLIGRKEPGNLYDAVVSSQFDADRLDYMQRDRLMSGVQSSGIDLTWLLANLEIASVRTGADDEGTGSIETLVLGPKAAQTAESYVLSLFHLYPNVYLHKTTRGAEKIFSALMRRVLQLGLDGNEVEIGLPVNHPILRFAREPEKLSHALGLDDMVFWGALPMLVDAKDAEIQKLALSLQKRHLPAGIDIRRRVEEALPIKEGEPRSIWRARITLACSRIQAALEAHPMAAADGPVRVLLDRYDRAPYKRYQDSNTPLNRILIRVGSGEPRDVAELSSVIAGAETFSVFRAYVFRGDTEAQKVVENIMRTELQRSEHGDA